jgi:hypothetical protein
MIVFSFLGLPNQDVFDIGSKNVQVRILALQSCRGSPSWAIKHGKIPLTRHNRQHGTAAHTK